MNKTIVPTRPWCVIGQTDAALYAAFLPAIGARGVLPKLKFRHSRSPSDAEVILAVQTVSSKQCKKDLT